MKKRLTALFLAFALVFALLPAAVLAASAATYSGTCGENLTWTLDTETGLLEISGTGEMTNWDWSSDAPWYDCRKSIKTVKMNFGVTSIGAYAFFDAFRDYSITSISIPYSVNSIGEWAFLGCKELTSISIPDSVTNIGVSAFVDTGYYNDVTNWVDDVLYIGNSLIAAKSTMPNKYTIKSGTRIIADAAFSDCGLWSITVPNSVTNIGSWAFGSIRYLYFLGTQEEWENIIIADNNKTLKAANTLYIYNGAIHGICGNELVWLFDVDTGILEVSGVGEMENWDPFSFTPWGDIRNSIESVSIAYGVTNIGECAFLNYKEISSVTFSNSVETIGNEAFSGCTGLKAITIPSSVTNIPCNAFTRCSLLESITVDDNNPVYDSRDNCNAIIETITDKLHIGCAKTIIPENVKSIGNMAFWGCAQLLSVTIPDGVTSIGEYAFYDCIGLTSVTIPDSVTSVGNSAFYGCAAMTDVYYDGTEEEWNTISIDMGNECLTEASIHFIGGCEHEYAHPEHKDATCTEAGYDRMICDDCGAVISEEVLLALGHDYIEHEAKAPTCTETGWKAYQTCNRCDYTTYAELPAIGHAHAHPEDKDATCTEAGYNRMICDDCGAVISEEVLSALGHNLVVDAAVAPTCTKTGLTEGKHCTRCDYKVAQEVVPALGHTWNDGKITKPATETEDGVKTYTCTVCGATKTEVIPATGEEVCKHENAHNDHMDATCTEDGYDRMICDDCGKVISEELIAALGHNVVKDEAVPATCTATGLTAGEHCTRCNYKVAQEVVPMLAHSFKDGVCTVCGAKDPIYKPAEPTKFNDVAKSAWYYDAVNYAVQNGLMNGVGGGNFAPDSSMTRAMLVTVLWRYEGSPEEGKNTFTDVPNGEWYTKAVAWAAANGIVGGVGNGKFDPNGNITREQMAAILFRYADKKGFDTSKRGDLSGFPDRAKVSGYASDAIAWTVAEKIIGGSDGKLLPQGNATRAQVSTILMRFIEGIAK